jgi:hypothetical protein
MALAIGFAGTFYTLWTVNTEESWSNTESGPVFNGYKTTFSYHQNLSKDLVEAQNKAAGFGCKDLTPDEELRGTRYITRFTPVNRESEVIIPEDCFQFGKYKGQKFEEIKVKDLDYLIWYALNSDAKIAHVLVAEESSLYCIYKGQFMTVELKNSKEHYNGVTEAFKSVGYIDALCERNQSRNQVNILGAWFRASNEVKEMSYQGAPYYLPVIDGKAKRVKGKFLRYFAELDEENNEYIVTRIELH